MENKHTKENATYSAENKKPEKGSNFTMPSAMKSKRHALRGDGIYCQKVWNQQFDSTFRAWSKEEKQKPKDKKLGSKKSEVSK